MDCIDMPLLSLVYDKHVSNLFPKKFNPFAEENLNRQLQVSCKKPEKTTQQSTNNGLKPRRKKKETPEEVLKTRWAMKWGNQWN